MKNNQKILVKVDSDHVFVTESLKKMLSNKNNSQETTKNTPLQNHSKKFYTLK
jgi:hypothetical protein